MRISWEYHGNIMGISWEYHENTMRISWEYHENIMRISLEYHGNIMRLSWEYHGNIMGISWEYHDRLPLRVFLFFFSVLLSLLLPQGFKVPGPRFMGPSSFIKHSSLALSPQHSTPSRFKV